MKVLDRSNSDPFLAGELLSGIKCTLFFRDCHATGFTPAAVPALLASRLPPSQEERGASGVRQMATKLSLLAQPHLFFLNKHFMDCCPPLVSKFRSSEKADFDNTCSYSNSFYGGATLAAPF